MGEEVKNMSKRILGDMKRFCDRALITALFIGLSMMDVKAQTEAQSQIPASGRGSLTAAGSGSPSPTPSYSPEEVIRIQIEALASNDDPYEDAGIEVAFRFASPANKVTTGPLDRFVRMVRNPVYSPMLNHKAARYGHLRVRGNQAAQPVILTTATGEHVGYFFILSKQSGGPYDGCWMTDSVIRFEVEDEEDDSYDA
jgi:hypothetical protein